MVPIRRRKRAAAGKIAAKSPEGYHSDRVRTEKEKAEDEEAYLLMNGYNIIFAWEELKSNWRRQYHERQDRLMDILSDYQGFRKMTLDSRI